MSKIWRTQFVRVVIGLVMSASLFLGWTITHGQGAKTAAIVYGESVAGELTNEAYEMQYRFAGTAGDVIIAQVERDYDNDTAPTTLDRPLLTLSDATGQLAQVDGFGTAVIAYQLAATMDYFLTVSRVDGATGTSVGAFKLSLFNPTELLPAMPVEGVITNEDTTYYWINTEDEVRLSYTRTDGLFGPEIAVLTAGEAGLQTVALLSGSAVDAGTLDLRIPPGDSLYFVRLQESLMDFNFEPVDAEYTLTLVVQKGVPRTQ